MKKLIAGLALIATQVTFALPYSSRISGTDFMRLDHINSNKVEFWVDYPGFKTNTCGFKFVFTNASKDNSVNMVEIVNDLVTEENSTIIAPHDDEESVFTYYFTQPYVSRYASSFSITTSSGKSFFSLAHENNLGADDMLGIVLIPCR